MSHIDFKIVLLCTHNPVNQQAPSRGDTPGRDEIDRLDSGSDAENADPQIESAGIKELNGESEA